MSVKVDEAGRRSVEVNVEVPGTPEEVWQAIATGPGISSWFVPTEIEKGEDGRPRRILMCFGEGWDSTADVTDWEPPRRFRAESFDWGSEAPVATEWIVEARSGGNCLVRVVHSLFADSDEWDGQLEGTEQGWPGFFRILRLYLTHFPGEPGSSFQIMGASKESAADAWSNLTHRLGLEGASPGERRTAPQGAPTLEGRVEHSAEQELLLRLEEPANGAAHLFALPMGDQVYLSVRYYLYGAGASAAAAQNEPVWRSWMKENVGSSVPGSCS